MSSRITRLPPSVLVWLLTSMLLTAYASQFSSQSGFDLNDLSPLEAVAVRKRMSERPIVA